MKKYSICLVLFAGLIFAGCGEIRQRMGVDDARRDLNQARGDLATAQDELNKLTELLEMSQLQIQLLATQINLLGNQNSQALADLQLELFNANVRLQTLNDLIVNGLPNPPALLIKKRLDWYNPADTPVIDLSTQATIGWYDLLAMKPNSSLKAIKVTTSQPLPYLLVSAYNEEFGYYTSGTQYGPATEFLLQSDTNTELSFMQTFGATTQLMFYTDTTGLDGQDVTFLVEYVLVSVDNAPEVQVADNFPSLTTLHIVERPRLNISVVAIETRTEPIGVDTTVVGFDLTNLSLLRTVVIPGFSWFDNYGWASGLTDWVVEGHVTSSTTGAIVELQLAEGDEIVIQPGETISVVIKANTTAKTPGDVIFLEGNRLEAHPEGETLNFPTYWEFSYKRWQTTLTQ